MICWINWTKLLRKNLLEESTKILRATSMRILRTPWQSLSSPLRQLPLTIQHMVLLTAGAPLQRPKIASCISEFPELLNLLTVAPTNATTLTVK